MLTTENFRKHLITNRKQIEKLAVPTDYLKKMRVSNFRRKIPQEKQAKHIKIGTLGMFMLSYENECRYVQEYHQSQVFYQSLYMDDAYRT